MHYTTVLLLSPHSYLNYALRIYKMQSYKICLYIAHSKTVAQFSHNKHHLCQQTT